MSLAYVIYHVSCHYLVDLFGVESSQHNAPLRTLRVYSYTVGSTKQKAYPCLIKYFNKHYIYTSRGLSFSSYKDIL